MVLFGPNHPEFPRKRSKCQASPKNSRSPVDRRYRRHSYRRYRRLYHQLSEQSLGCHFRDHYHYQGRSSNQQGLVRRCLVFHCR